MLEDVEDNIKIQSFNDHKGQVNEVQKKTFIKKLWLSTGDKL